MVAGNVHGLLDMRPPFFSYTSPNAPPPMFVLVFYFPLCICCECDPLNKRMWMLRGKGTWWNWLPGIGCKGASAGCEHSHLSPSHVQTLFFIRLLCCSHGSRAVFDLSGSMDLGAGLPPVVPVVAAAPAMVAPPVGTNASPVQYLAPPQHQQQHQQHQRSPVTYVYPPLGSFYHHPPMGHPALRRGPVMVRRGPIFLGRRGYW